MYREWKKIEFPKRYYIWIWEQQDWEVNQDGVREDGRIVDEEGWQEKVYNREEWKKLLRTARNCRILHMPMEWMNEFPTSVFYEWTSIQLGSFSGLSLRDYSLWKVCMLSVFYSGGFWCVDVFRSLWLRCVSGWWRRTGLRVLWAVTTIPLWTSTESSLVNFWSY